MGSATHGRLSISRNPSKNGKGKTLNCSRSAAERKQVPSRSLENSKKRGYGETRPINSHSLRLGVSARKLLIQKNMFADQAHSEAIEPRIPQVNADIFQSERDWRFVPTSAFICIICGFNNSASSPQFAVVKGPTTPPFTVFA